MAQTRKSEPTVNLTDELRQVVQRAEQGDRSVLPALRKLLDDNPALWRHYGDLAAAAERAWLELACGQNLALRESIVRKLDELRIELGSEAASPLERLLVDRVVSCWLQVHHADVHLAQLRGSSPDPARIKLATHLLDRAQQRYLTAIKQLATVRKLLRTVPSPIEVAARFQGDLATARPRRNASPMTGVGVSN